MNRGGFIVLGQRQTTADSRTIVIGSEMLCRLFKGEEAQDIFGPGRPDLASPLVTCPEHSCANRNQPGDTLKGVDVAFSPSPTRSCAFPCECDHRVPALSYPPLMLIWITALVHLLCLGSQVFAQDCPKVRGLPVPWITSALVSSPFSLTWLAAGYLNLIAFSAAATKWHDGDPIS